jgi:hypothetical protein
LNISLIKKAIKGIFPKGTEIANNSVDVSPEERFWLIAGKNGPRWLIPQEKKYGLIVFHQWRPYELVSVVKWRLLQTAYFAGHLQILPGVCALGISGSIKNEWQHIGWKKETGPVPVIYFGTPCKTRKVVTLLIDSKTSMINLVAKMPLSKPASKSIEHEFKILCDLQHEKARISPRPIFLNKETGIAVQEAVNGHPIGRNYTILHHKFLESLRLSKKTISLYEKSLQIKKELESINLRRPSLNIILNGLLKNCTDSAKYSQVYVHGDFTPWNIKKIENGSLTALDWEMGDPNGLPFYDFFYYFLIQCYLFNEKFNSNRIFKLLSEYKTKYPLMQILNLTATSLGLRLAKAEQNTENLENFLRSISC